MTKVTSYNLVKEGDLYNAAISGSYLVTASGLDLLYNGDINSVAYTLPSGSISAIELSFGEYFDVNSIKYYTSSVIVGDIQVGYGRDSYTENTVSLVSSGTYVFGDINSVVGKIRVTHSGSSSVGVNQFFVEGVLNDKLWFGNSEERLDGVFLENTPLKNYSSSVTAIPIYNDYKETIDAKVSILPTSSGYDYLYISNNESGPFYGINDFGRKQPAFLKLTTTSDSLTYSSLASLYSNWDITNNLESYFSLGSDYIQFNVTADNGYSYRQISSYNDMTSISFVAKDYFTADQSFSVSLKVRYYDADFVVDYKSINKVLLGFTDTYPIRENCAPLIFQRDYPYFNRGTNSLAAVWYGAVILDNDISEYQDLKAGSAICLNDYTSFTDFNSYRQESGLDAHNALIAGVDVEELSSTIFGEPSYEDGSPSSPWRTLSLSYNHKQRVVSYYFDNLFIGNYRIPAESFTDRCKLFFCFNGFGPATIQFKDFVVSDEVKHPIVLQEQATALRSYDVAGQGPSKLIDGNYDLNQGPYYYEHAWVSGKDPVNTDYITISFSEPTDVDAVRIKQAAYSDIITISGSIISNPGYSLKRAVLTFDSGDIRTVEFADEPLDGLGGWDYSYLTTLSGTVESVYGVNSVEMRFYSFNERGPGVSAFVVDELEFYSLGYLDIPTTMSGSSNEVAWGKGSFYNIKSDGSVYVNTINESNRYDYACRQDVWRLDRYYDYDAKNVVYNSEYQVGELNYHYAESVFSHSKFTGDSRRTIHSLSGPSSWAWRCFEHKIDVSAVYISVKDFVTGETGIFESLADSWKLQYLVPGGNPNNNYDWVDIPPITEASAVSEYATYTQYLVDNNDGEYYTNFSSIGSDFTYTSEGMVCYDNVYSVLNFRNRATVYVEFSEVYNTRGIRLVINYGYQYRNLGQPALGYSIFDFYIYSQVPHAFYVSPVFDTGTKQNTERIRGEIEEWSGTSSIMYRSSSTPPKYTREFKYESWEDMGAPYAGLGEMPSYGIFYNADPCLVSDGTYIYFVPTHPAPQAGYIYRYTLDSGKWGRYAALSVESDSSIIAADPRTTNPAVYMNGAIYMASRSGDGPYTSGISVLYLSPTAYDYSGWQNFPYQRQVSAIYATMVSDGISKIYFLGEDGEITVFDSLSGSLSNEAREDIPKHGYSTRSGMAACCYGGKIYVAGGEYTNYFDIYNIEANEWSTGPSLPYTINNASIFYHSGCLYLFPMGTDNEKACHMKYNISGEYWSVVQSLNYNTATHLLDILGSYETNSPAPYSLCYLGGYVYSFNRYRYDFRRACLNTSSWSDGEYPSFDYEDLIWRNGGGMEWNEVTISGELMPQDRYIQYKVDLTSVSGTSSPLLYGISLVSPITVEDIPSYSSKNIYLKTHIIDKSEYFMWYTGKRYVHSAAWPDSILQCKSVDGLDFHSSYVVDDSYTYNGADGPYAYRDPCVIPTASGFTMWAVKAECASYGGFSFTDATIYRSTSSDGIAWCDFSSCLEQSSEGTYDVSSVYSPWVKKDTIYKIWYTGEDASFVPRIIYAESTDGISWNNYILSHDINTLLLDGGPDETGVKHPSVVFYSGYYWMYYEGLDSESVSSIILCKSIDGIAWSGHSVIFDSSIIDNVVDILGCGQPCVVCDEDDFYMWFVVYTVNGESIAHSSSIGGLVWSSPELILSRGHKSGFDDRGVSTPHVVIVRDFPKEGTFLAPKLKVYND